LRSPLPPLQTISAKLDSYGPERLGAYVPVQKFDFGCRGLLFGGELALQTRTIRFNGHCASELTKAFLHSSDPDP